jgi:hypothetical protein
MMPQYLILRLVVLLVLFIGTEVVFSQQQDFLQGRLYDIETGEGVAFATVYFEGNALGVVSNEDGSFLIPSRFREWGGLLRISSMGYESLRVTVSSLQSDTVNRIALSPRIFELSETVLEGSRIKKRSARNIVRTAIRRIPDNYPTFPFRLIGYYRDYQKKSDKYTNLNEAILEVNDLGFHNNDKETTRVLLYDYKENSEFSRDTLAMGPYDYQRWSKVITNAYLYNYGGNEFSILRIHDALRNHDAMTYSFVEQLDRDFMGNHNFKRLKDTHIDEVACYAIGFKTRKGNYSAEGTIIIARHNFAVYRLNYDLYDEAALPIEGTDGRDREHGGLLKFSVRTEYRPRKTSMHLNYISFRNNFRLTKPPKFSVDSVVVDLERGYFQAYFNKVPTMKTALDLTNYKALLAGKSIKLAEAEVVDSSVVLFPTKDKAHLLNTLTKYSGEDVGAGEASLSIIGVKDNEGNLVDVPEKLDMLQFREFFTQKIQEEVRLLPDSNYMLKERPIFKEQPVYRPDNFEEYWMNTPLQDSN